MVILQSTNETKLVEELLDNSTKAVTKGYNTLGSLMQLIGLVIVLIIILIAAYYTSKFVGGAKLNQLKESNFKVIDTYRISPTKMLQIVQIGTKYIVISIGKDTVNYITELEEKDVKLKEASESTSFKQILEKVRKNKGKG